MKNSDAPITCKATSRLRVRGSYGILFAMKTLSLSKFICLAGLCSATAAFSATLDGLAAKVNDDVITIDEVASEMRHTGALMATGDFSKAYSNAVESVINRRLILRAAAERKLEMQEWIVDNRVREIVKDNFGGDMNKLQSSLAQSRVALPDWRNQIRDEMIVQAMRFQLVEKNAEASPAAMEREYKLHPERYHMKAQTSVSVILLRPPADDKMPSVEKRAREVLDRLAKGESFVSLAKTFSSDSHAKDGGLWKNVKPEEAFRPEIAAAIKKLRVGQTSPLLNLDGWGFIVRKIEETKDQTRSFAEAYNDIAANVKKQEMEVLYKEWIARLRADAFIKIYPPPSEH